MIPLAKLVTGFAILLLPISLPSQCFRGGGGNGSAAVATVPVGRFGVVGGPILSDRLDTSWSRLQIAWQPAFGDNADDKPLLIYRQSDRRDAKLEAGCAKALHDERLVLASQWFHCVVVGDEVLEKSHPLHPCFAGKHPPALVLRTTDGKKQVSFLGTPQQRASWAPIAGILQAAYGRDPTHAVRGLEKLLRTFDRIDREQYELIAQLERAMNKPNLSRVKSLKAKLAKVDEKRRLAVAAEQTLRQLKVHRPGRP